MHIPDGYLSPSTCATMYGLSTPFWYAALRRAKNALNTRTVPLLALFAAFCFVIMLFNLPLPGGTTGHGVGMAMAAIVLGPWASILAISMALLIQALFFGDGGITAFGANCFNMAIVGSLVAYGVYRLIARGADITAKRRVIAAGIAGYSAINLAALCAAIEFGVQPILFHTAAGTPLYAPYPLSISIPAMMIGHLSVAGLAELVISAGIVDYLQRADPEILRFTAPDAPFLERAPEASSQLDSRRFAVTSRKLWLGLALALILTPLGILAVGSAWGEWSARNFSDAAARLSSLWRAPVPSYAPAFIKSSYFGYFLSAATGVGLIVLLSLAVAWFVSRSPQSRERRPSQGFVERTTKSLIAALEETVFAEATANSSGFLQRCDPRVKLAGIGALIVSTVAVHRIWTVAVLFAVAVLLGLCSRVRVTLLAKRVWIPVLVFTGAIALPAIFLVPGDAVYQVPALGWSIIVQGLRSASLLVLRAETTATLALLLILSTPWNRLLRALRFFRVPAGAVIILGMTYRYIFLFLKTSQEMMESRRARRIGSLDLPALRRLASSMVGVLLDKTLKLSNDVHLAMQARGFRGEVRLIDDFEMQTADWFQLAGLLAVASVTAWAGW